VVDGWDGVDGLMDGRHRMCGLRKYGEEAGVEGGARSGQASSTYLLYLVKQGPWMRWAFYYSTVLE
jgi:hypothetical protein